MARTRTPQTLVASAARIKLSQRGAGEAVPRKQEWQTEAMAFRRDVPEVGFATRFVGSQLSKIRLYVGYRPKGSDPNSEPIPLDADASTCPPNVAAIAIAELDRLKSGSPSLAGFLRRFAVNIDLVGECYLIGISATANDPEQWSIRSISEVDVGNDGKVTVKSHPADKGIVLRDGLDTCIRMFLADEEWTDRASAPMEYLLTDLRSLQVLTQQIYAESISRLSAGILLVPNEFSPAPIEATAGDDPTEDEFVTKLIETLASPVEDSSSAASIVPATIRGPGDYIEKVRHLSFGRDPDNQLEARLDGRINRVARGLDLPVEVIMGHMATTFANAEQIDQDVYEDHLQHRCVAMVEMMTYGYLAPNLRDNREVPDEWAEVIEVWYDPSALLSQPDPEQNADSGHEKMALSDEAWRRYKGFTEDDAPTAEEIVRRMVERRGVFTGDITTALLRFLAFGNSIEDLQLPVYVQPVAPPGELPAVPPDETLPPGTTGGPPAPPPPPAPVPPAAPAQQAAQPTEQAAAAPMPARTASATAGQSDVLRSFLGGLFENALRSPAAVLAAAPAPGAPVRKGRPLGQRLTEIDRDLRTRILVAASQAVERALEKAGNRLKAKAGKIRETLKAVPPRNCAAYLGRSVVADAGFSADQLLADAFESLHALYLGWGADAQAEALAAVNAAVGGLNPTTKAAVQARQAADLVSSWEWFETELTALLHARMFDPNPTAPPGEYDPSMVVPAGLVRGAMARMGGKRTTVAAAGAWVQIVAGGVGTGDLMMDTYSEAGGSVEAYEWVYGPAARAHPFEPHQALDGVVFDNFDDDVLANDEGWPEAPYFFPGDHDGCVPAGTVVSGPAPHGATLRYYEGEMVVARLACGQDLSATPNHPVLTRRGWVPIGLLREGDEVVRDSLDHGIAALVPDDHQVPTRIEDVTRAFGMSERVVACAVPVAAVDFDGDGTEGEVCVVWSDRLLVDGRPATSSEPGSQAPLGLDYEGALLLTGERGSLQRLGAVGPSPLRLEGEGRQPMAFVWRPGGTEQELCIPAATWLDADRTEPLADRVPIDAEVLGQSLDGLTGFVTLDKVIAVDRHAFSGHVFNLTTSVNWYVANGTVIHNCLCDFNPITLDPSEVDSAGGGSGSDMSAGDLADLLDAGMADELIDGAGVNTLEDPTSWRDEAAAAGASSSTSSTKSPSNARRVPTMAPTSKPTKG